MGSRKYIGVGSGTAQLCCGLGHMVSGHSVLVMCIRPNTSTDQSDPVFDHFVLAIWILMKVHHCTLNAGKNARFVLRTLFVEIMTLHDFTNINNDNIDM